MDHFEKGGVGTCATYAFQQNIVLYSIIYLYHYEENSHIRTHSILWKV